MERKVFEYLLGRGFSREEASLVAFLAVDALKEGTLAPEEAREAYGLDEKQCRDIEWSAQMHDIGKIAIPDAILNKPARLTDEEYAKMKTHTTSGAENLHCDLGFRLRKDGVYPAIMDQVPAKDWRPYSDRK